MRISKFVVSRIMQLPRISFPNRGSKKVFLMRKLGKTLESQSGLMAAEEKVGTSSNSCQLRAKAGDLPEN